ncbi:ATP-binding cassette domain-containing protein [Jeotgalibacillus salarius]|uniref:ABC transporter ATP-binding protein n=1 Tax=Jeotgalibacillus salarius TaxID=546023 RepID=A0A4Y8LHP0_9BACL|nr:ABC transporter ATP-binding protein [Jeotgalibacillus salarius]TFE00575.1 ABC transporter ATP-binding protein [Jeotgalibacillus salarius]
MTADILIDKVSVKYKNFHALDNVSLNLDREKIYGLIGRNGAGKTTLLSLLASFAEPDEGSIQVNGHPLFENAELMQQVTFVYEKDLKEESEKVKTYLNATAEYKPNFDAEYAMELVETFNLPLNKPVYKLSKGMQSVLNVVIGLASRSPITIFDEAYSGMDAPTREIFYQQLLEDHARHPRTIILSTHLVSEMDYLFEEAVILHKGKVLLHEPVDVVLEKGASVTGAAEVVDEFVSGMNQIHTQKLGGTKSVMVIDPLSEEQQARASQSGLEIGPVSLQDLFIHLTKEEGQHGSK